ncbi:Hypothetical_protein [Hexamita inflata]|uniref:Hypothetical_protein n=1 Tax=Hexamita inflata TaxID=28002 RepID=A0ABP1GUZ4_9EUKA
MAGRLLFNRTMMFVAAGVWRHFLSCGAERWPSYFFKQHIQLPLRILLNDLTSSLIQFFLFRFCWEPFGLLYSVLLWLFCLLCSVCFCDLNDWLFCLKDLFIELEHDQIRD